MQTLLAFLIYPAEDSDPVIRDKSYTLTAAMPRHQRGAREERF